MRCASAAMKHLTGMAQVHTCPDYLNIIPANTGDVNDFGGMNSWIRWDRAGFGQVHFTLFQITCLLVERLGGQIAAAGQ